jgi:hypothetical protein
MSDIIMFSRSANPENISSILCATKKQDSGSSTLIKHWHPSEYVGAYGFLFSNDPIMREGEEGSVDCSLKELVKHLPHESSIQIIREFVMGKIVSHLGYFPAQACGMQVYVDTESKEISMKKLETNVFDKLVQLTREGKLEWFVSDDPNEKGAAPELIDDRGMELEGTYLASYEDGNGTLTCTLSKYLKNTEKKKNYSEYVICIQLIRDGDDGYSSHLVSKGMGKLWNIINKRAPLDSGNLSIKELSSFLSELCD